MKIAISQSQIPALERIFPGIEVQSAKGGILNPVEIKTVDLDPASKNKWDRFNEIHDEISLRSFCKQFQ